MLDGWEVRSCVIISSLPRTKNKTPSGRLFSTTLKAERKRVTFKGHYEGLDDPLNEYVFIFPAVTGPLWLRLIKSSNQLIDIECRVLNLVTNFRSLLPFNLGPLHTRDWGPVTIALQALSLVEKAEPVQVHYFTLRLRDQRSMRMQDGCKDYMDSYMASNGLSFMVTWTNWKNHLLEVGLTQN
jgi:hypothetical protein